MKTHMRKQRGALALTILAAGSLALWGGSGDEDAGSDAPPGFAVAKATCAAGDNPEMALQGQVTAAERAAGFKGTNCNLTLVGQSKNEGGNWSTAKFRDRFGKVCAY